jgi:uncharacterized membrane protein YgdD (TMEM256/DUF423 family)
VNSINPLNKYLATAAFTLTLAVLIGAFGAHGLKSIVTADKLITFETGVRYHFYHGLGLFLVAICQHLFTGLNLKVSFYSFLVGIILFSFNCYFYVLSDIKIFAILVPLGGALFVVGWGALGWKFLKLGQ